MKTIKIASLVILTTFLFGCEGALEQVIPVGRIIQVENHREHSFSDKVIIKLEIHNSGAKGDLKIVVVDLDSQGNIVGKEVDNAYFTADERRTVTLEHVISEEVISFYYLAIAKSLWGNMTEENRQDLLENKIKSNN